MIPPLPPTWEPEHNTPVIESHLQESDWDPETRHISTFILVDSSMQEREGLCIRNGSSWPSFDPTSRIRNSAYSGSRFPYTRPYSTLVNQMFSDLVCVQDQTSAVPESGLPFDSNNSDSSFTPLSPTQDSIPWISPEYSSSPVGVEGFAVNDFWPQTCDEVPGYCIYSTPSLPPYASGPDLQTSSLGQDTEESFLNPYASPPVDIPLPNIGTGHAAARIPVISSFTPNLVDPTVGIYSPLYPGESFQEVDYGANNGAHSAHTLSNQVLQAAQSVSYAASPPSKQPLILPDTPVYLCAWKDGNGSVCSEVITSASLPEHLSAHGIRNMSRDQVTKCNWDGCTRKTPMNRESIVRHIREVHFKLKRSSKRSQDSYL